MLTMRVHNELQVSIEENIEEKLLIHMINKIIITFIELQFFFLILIAAWSEQNRNNKRNNLRLFASLKWTRHLR